MEKFSHSHSSASVLSESGGYMNAKDVYHYFGKRISLDSCIELLHQGYIRSARIGGKLLTKHEYLREFEEKMFYRTESPDVSGLLSTLAVSHKGIVRRTPKQRYRPLKPR